MSLLRGGPNLKSIAHQNTIFAIITDCFELSGLVIVHETGIAVSRFTFSVSYSHNDFGITFICGGKYIGKILLQRQTVIVDNIQ